MYPCKMSGDPGVCASNVTLTASFVPGTLPTVVEMTTASSNSSSLQNSHVLLDVVSFQVQLEVKHFNTFCGPHL